MAHGTATNSIELSGDAKSFDRVARKWNVDYAFYKTGPDKYLLFFKAGQADAMTACFSEYSRKVLSKAKSNRVPIREQLQQAADQLSKVSVIQNPRQHSKGRFLHYGQWIGKKPPSAKQRVRLAVLAALEKKPTDFADFLRLMEESGFAVKQGRGGVISFLAPGQEKPTRLRASTLGAGFDPEDIKAVIAGERPLPELPEEPTVPPRRVNLIIDIQERMAQGKGPAYERWAKVYNLKQMAAALQYLQEHHLTDYAALTARTEAAVDHFHKLSDELRTTEEALSKTSELMAATVDYAKTRPVFDGYKAARYSKKYLAQHEAELATYRAAKDTMNTILNGAKLPKIEALKKSRRELAGQKKELYAEYRETQRQMREAVAIKANIDHLLGITDERENKAQER